MIVMWDRGNMHKGGPINDLVRDAGEVGLRPLPARLDLVPIKPLWNWLKYGRLCNFTPGDAPHLNNGWSANWTPYERISCACGVSSAYPVLHAADMTC